MGSEVAIFNAVSQHVPPVIATMITEYTQIKEPIFFVLHPDAMDLREYTPHMFLEDNHERMRMVFREGSDLVIDHPFSVPRLREETHCNRKNTFYCFARKGGCIGKSRRDEGSPSLVYQDESLEDQFLRIIKHSPDGDIVCEIRFNVQGQPISYLDSIPDEDVNTEIHVKRLQGGKLEFITSITVPGVCRVACDSDQSHVMLVTKNKDVFQYTIFELEKFESKLEWTTIPNEMVFDKVRLNGNEYRMCYMSVDIQNKAIILAETKDRYFRFCIVRL